MAILITPYTDINATMRGIRTQIIDSLDYCVNSMPKFKDPEQMFKTLKNLVTYKNDPHGVELLQTVPTLFEDNFWGIPGAGDCDCFTILVISCCIANGWNDNSIILCGRSKISPVHIYSKVYYKNKCYCMDLTNSYINIERKYKFKQELKV